MTRTALAAAALAAVAVTATPAVASAPTPPHRAAWMRTACVEEDSVDCYWNARTMGNGHGHSFYARRIPGTGTVCRFYVGRRFARHNDTCEVTR
jgi:hypothetical protein